MNVGILTFHNGINYGGTLQCYALQQVIEEMGHNVVVLNFAITQRRSFIKQNFDRLISISSFKDIKSILTALRGKKKHKLSALTTDETNTVKRYFDEYRKQLLHETERVNETNIASVANKLDCVVIGSDQVWADIHEKKPVFLAGWEPSFNGKRIAYAACTPVNCVQRPHRRKVKRLLKRFCGISTRDTHTKKVIPDSFGIDAKVVVDPTMLYQGWKKSEQRPINGGYILLYVLRGEIKGGITNAISLLRKKYPSRKVISILSPETSVIRGFEGIDEFVIPTPNEWIQLIANADVLLTDSFHGSVFASKFSVPFISYYNDASEGKFRLIELQQILDLKNNFVKNIDEMAASIENGIEYKLKNIPLIKESKEWLKSKLENQ